MKRVTLERVRFSDEGTFGVVGLEGSTFRLYSGELPWKDNKSFVSCIPEGLYTCMHNYSPRFKKNTYLVENVPGRTAIRIHVCNFVGDEDKGYVSEIGGCIGLGTGIWPMVAKNASGFPVQQVGLEKSIEAVRLFEEKLKFEDFELVISSRPATRSDIALLKAVH